MSFAFTSPWVLGLLASLPLLWWLLRLTPPAPKKIIFPALMLLRDLATPSQTPARTPWWLLLLRLTIVALLIVGLAGPILNPPNATTGNGALLIAIDNDWAAARDWDLRQNAMRDAIRTAADANRQVALLATTPSAQGDAPQIIGPLAAPAALQTTMNITPQPWPADWQKAAAAVQALPTGSVGETLWLTSGVGGIDARSFNEALQKLGPVRALADPLHPIYTLQPPQIDPDDTDPKTNLLPRLTVQRAVTDDPAIVTVAAIAQNGNTLASLPVAFTAGSPQSSVPLDVPLDIRNRIARFQIREQTTAATTVLMDSAWQHLPVGIVGDQSELDQHSLLSGLFYLDRALKPFADLHIDRLSALIDQKMAVIVLPDTALPNDATAATLKNWITHGGVLIRFAGTKLAGQNAATTDDNGNAAAAPATPADTDLLPVTLRSGGRALGGSLSWDTPQKLQAFPASSPFFGLEIPADVTVSRQLLAEPSPDLTARSWAALADGTPLVTAKALGQGLTILFHVPASTNWSSLPLSGLFVDMLHRLIGLAHGIGANADKAAPAATLLPLRALDAFGDLQDPGPAAQSIGEGDIGHIAVSPQHPPGLYGIAANSHAFNLGPALGQPVALNSIATEPYRQDNATKTLRPYLLIAGFLLLLGDFALSLRLRGLLAFKRRANVAAFILCITLAASAQAAEPNHAADLNADAVELTSKTYLAYVVTGDRDLDHVAQLGLEGLARALQSRTSMDRVAVTGVSPESDQLPLFPLLYWPLSVSEAPVSPQAAQHINDYLRHGGMILFDTMTGEALPPLVLRHILQGIDIPPLQRLPENHVLKHSYYLLDQFPGRYDNNDFWIEPDDASTHDGVATVLSGENGWAAAWAVDETGRPLFPCTPGGEVQRERAYRFGINLVMYALTGNYKSDQLHAQALLQKLGK